MKIEIKITDQENGHVKIDCKPTIQKLIDIYRKYQEGSSSPPPSLVYAVLAIKKMQGDSDMIETEQDRERQNKMQRNGLIMPGEIN